MLFVNCPGLNRTGVYRRTDKTLFNSAPPGSPWWPVAGRLKACYPAALQGSGALIPSLKVPLLPRALLDGRESGLADAHHSAGALAPRHNGNGGVAGLRREPALSANMSETPPAESLM